MTIALAFNFDKIPEDKRAELLLELGKNNNGADVIALIIMFSFEKYIKNTKDLVLKISKNKDAIFVPLLIANKLKNYQKIYKIYYLRWGEIKKQ